MINVAIDGPAGAGKSTIAKELANKIGFIYVDTGALYRTVAVHLLNENIDPKDTEKVEESLQNIKVTMKHMPDGQHMFLGGEDVTTKIRTPQVSMVASTSSAIPAVRAFLFELQINMAEKYNVIMDGRDIGTVVLPNAQVKIFLTASAEIRANRRLLDLKEKGIEDTFENVLADVKQRDYQDENRAVAPLKPADDGVIVDTSELNFEQVLETLEKIIKEKTNA
ncbi:MAG: (d)CMP kinase [Clostridia bacterium]